MPTTLRFSSEAIKEIIQPRRKGRLCEGKQIKRFACFPTRLGKNRRCPRFVIQEHNATHLHWDFRLEMNGVLKSWALPKRPPRSKTIKRLAIQVEDHLRSYVNFEGEIKEGYGKGIVKIWDKGTYNLIEKTPKKIEFELKGKRLSGKYVLIKAELNDDKRNWLFFRTE